MKQMTILIAMMLSVAVYSQDVEATTKDGKKVLLHPNGTWEYKSDSLKVDTTTFKCSDWVVNSEDKVSGEKYIVSDSAWVFSADNKNGFIISFIKSSNGVVILTILTYGGSNCIPKDALCEILFTDGTRTSFTGHQEFNCDNEFTVYLSKKFKTEETMNLLSTKVIEMMRIKTAEGSVTQTFDLKEATTFKMAMDCLRFKY